MLISQPGSDYQLTQITLDAGRARDITFLLTDIHGLLSDLCLDPARPEITELAQAILLNCDSPYTPDALTGALDEVITTLTHAIRDAVRHIQPPASQFRPATTRGARSKENHPPRTRKGGAGSKKNSGPTWG